jgi:hypothetical protein
MVPLQHLKPGKPPMLVFVWLCVAIPTADFYPIVGWFAMIFFVGFEVVACPLYALVASLKLFVNGFHASWDACGS